MVSANRLCREQLGVHSTAISLDPRNRGRKRPRTRCRGEMKRELPRQQYGRSMPVRPRERVGMLPETWSCPAMAPPLRMPGTTRQQGKMGKKRERNRPGHRGRRRGLPGTCSDAASSPLHCQLYTTAGTKCGIGNRNSRENYRKPPFQCSKGAFSACRSAISPTPQTLVA